jgi:plasmid stabilization system protein ParE
MKENLRYRASSRAEIDLIEMWQYIADYNVSAANRLNDSLGIVCELLGRNPLLGEMFDPARPSLRRFAHENYVVYYNATTDPILIVRVLHGARDTTSFNLNRAAGASRSAISAIEPCLCHSDWAAVGFASAFAR